MLKQKRHIKGLSQSELAKKLKIHRSYVSRLERKVKGYSPSLDLIIRLSEELQCCPIELFLSFTNINCKRFKRKE